MHTRGTRQQAYERELTLAQGNTGSHRQDSSTLAGGKLFARHEMYADAERVHQYLLP